MKKKKVTSVDVIKMRTDVLNKIDAFKTKLEDKIYQPTMKAFLKDNIPYLRGKVYEVVANGIKRRGFKRFVIYSFDCQFIRSREEKECRHMMVRAGGWWLDENNVPAKWDGMTVFGVSNPTTFKLSDNQVNNKVPNHLK